jgi:penicillin-binding protein-related factor A (putative recombinase)
MGTEKELESQILRFLNLQQDIFAFKVNTTGIFDPSKKVYRRITNPYIHKGTSDIIGVCRGIFFAFEVKTPRTYKKAVSSESFQNVFIKRVRAKRGFAHFVSSMDQVLEIIRAMRRVKDTY